MDENRNSWVYVSGLPLDITEDEFTELMSKYGIIMETDEGRVCLSYSYALLTSTCSS